MATITTPSPLLVIVGETASGKTALGIKLAQKFDGEIIAGDGRTIYRGMDIGTAKPSADEQKLVPHHLIDQLDIGEPITAALFKQQVLAAIDRATAKGKLPILVGGSGLYIDSVLFDYAFNAPVDPNERLRLQGLTVQELQAELEARNIALPENDQNPRHLMRALETNGHPAERAALRPRTLILGTTVDADARRHNASRRVQAMMMAGLEDEVRRLVELHGWNDQLANTIGYKEFKKYFEGAQTLAQVQEAIVRDTLAYAKRQRTWFKRNQNIIYPSNSEQAVELVTTWLNKLR